MLLHGHITWTVIINALLMHSQSIHRWIKFEEDVEEGGERWSKPHVATLSLHSLFELRCNILNGTVMLDVEAFDQPSLFGMFSPFSHIYKPDFIKIILL